jgi:hypothetical protein
MPVEVPRARANHPDQQNQSRTRPIFKHNRYLLHISRVLPELSLAQRYDRSALSSPSAAAGSCPIPPSQSLSILLHPLSLPVACRVCRCAVPCYAVSVSAMHDDTMHRLRRAESPSKPLPLPTQTIVPSKATAATVAVFPQSPLFLLAFSYTDVCALAQFIYTVYQTQWLPLTPSPSVTPP